VTEHLLKTVVLLRILEYFVQVCMVDFFPFFSCCWKCYLSDFWKSRYNSSGACCWWRY